MKASGLRPNTRVEPGLGARVSTIRKFGVLLIFAASGGMLTAGSVELATGVLRPFSKAALAYFAHRGGTASIVVVVVWAVFAIGVILLSCIPVLLAVLTVRGAPAARIVLLIVSLLLAVAIASRAVLGIVIALLLVAGSVMALIPEGRRLPPRGRIKR
jgi:hypothetical protein